LSAVRMWRREGAVPRRTRRGFCRTRNRIAACLYDDACIWMEIKVQQTQQIEVHAVVVKRYSYLPYALHLR
jgi:hypothetical protein